MAVTDGEFWLDKKGERVHLGMITDDKKLKDALVETLVTRASRASKLMSDFKESAFSDVASFMEILREKYGMVQKETKGNLTLENFSSTKKVQISVAHSIKFDEKLILAKEKIDEFLTRETKNSSEKIKTLIFRAFDVDKKGEVNAKKILALKAYNMEDALWDEAMAILDEAIEIVSSKNYIRFYQRDSHEAEWEHISLDLSAV